MLRIIVIIYLLLPLHIAAQQDIYLNIRNTRRPVQIKFQRGADITLKMDGEKLKYHGIIDQINDSALVLDGISFPYSRITGIVLPRKVAKAIKYGALSSIPFFITITALDRGINQNTSPLVDESALRLTTAYAVLAGVSHIFQNRKIKIGKRWEIHKLDLRP